MVNLTLLPLAPTEAPHGANREFRTFAQIVADHANDKAVVTNIVGMSGGPVFGITKSRRGVQYRVIGIQSRWFHPSRKLAFCPAYSFFHALQDAAARRLELALMESLPWQSQRISLRQLVRGDAAFLQATFSNQVMWKDLGGPKPFDSIAAARSAVQTKKGMLGTMMVVERKDDAVPLGLAAFYFNQQIGDAESDFLIAFLPEHQQHGYGREVLVLLAQHWMSGSKRDYCTAMVSPQNTGSIRLLTKLGFVQIGECDSKAGRSYVFRGTAKGLENPH
jgi:RimJ/RimL family protein N-acetyltransferase